MKRPNREDYPNGTYGDIEYDEKIEKYCTYLEQKLASNTEIIGSVSDLFINTEYLMELHPELNKEEAESLKEYAASRTIEYKECYGDGSIIYPKWKKESNR